MAVQKSGISQGRDRLSGLEMAAMHHGCEQNSAQFAQKDLDVRWAVKWAKAKPLKDGTLPAVEPAIPAFGYKNHMAVDPTSGESEDWQGQPRFLERPAFANLEWRWRRTRRL